MLEPSGQKLENKGVMGRKSFRLLYQICGSREFSVVSVLFKEHMQMNNFKKL